MAKKSQSSGKRRHRIVIVFVILALILIFLVAYAGMVSHYQKHFLPGSTVNGMDVSDMTVAEVEQVLLNNQERYSLTLIERNGVTETISGEEIDFSIVFDGSLNRLLEEQEVWTWPLSQWSGRTQTMEVDTMFSYDEQALEEAIGNLACLDEASMIEPVDAYLSDYDPETGGVEVVEEEKGTWIDADILIPAIREAVAAMEPSLNLEETGCYASPAVTSTDAALNEEADYLNQYLGLEITYEFGDKTEVINGEQLLQWYTFEDDGSVTLDEEQVADFVHNLSYTYSTIFSDRVFQTSYGREITVEGGDYGWWMDESTEIEELTEQILNGESGVREPVWFQEAQSFGDSNQDYGDTYIEVNLTAQHLFFYKDGELFLESDFVSGQKEGATPTGTYGILYCERYATLEGENYSSPVSYWMPFYNGVGLHDAPWRISFGANLYQTNGSHGCINLPISVARSIYENVSPGTAVIIYEMEGTESTSTTEQSYEDIASAIVEALDEISSEGEITGDNYKQMAKKITWVQAAYSSLSGGAQALVTNYGELSTALRALEEYEAQHGLTSADRTD